MNSTVSSASRISSPSDSSTVPGPLGRRVPDDLSVIGFDDILQSDWAPYRLTTIRQSMEHLTASIVEAIEQLGPARRRLPIHHVVPVELVERDTVRPRL